MPQVHRSFYTDQAHGGRYWTFLSEELPEVVGGFFRVSDRREDTFVAGLSMGGYGALKWALHRPDRFAAAASLSGALDMASRALRDDLEPGLMETLFGGRPVAGSGDDLLHLLAGVSPEGVPPLYIACGTEDGLISENQRFVDAARRARVPVTVDVGPGEHEWGYWDARIQDVLAWLPLRRSS
jgi:S-formylglutathione hydrolase FrmB